MVIGSPRAVLLGQGPASVFAEAFERAGGRAVQAGDLSGALHAIRTGEADALAAFVGSRGEAESLVASVKEAGCPAVPVAVFGPGFAGEDGRSVETRLVNCICRSIPADQSDAAMLVALALNSGRTRQLEREIPARIEELEGLRRFTSELVSQLPSRLYVVDDEHRVLFANRTALDDTGSEHLMVIGKLFTELTPFQAEGDPVTETVRMVLSDDRSRRLPRLRLRRKTSGEMVANVSVDPCTLAGLKCARVTIDDVTDEWMSDLARLREARKLEDVVGAIAAGFAVLSPEMKITWMNRCFAEWFGPQLGRSCCDMFGVGGCTREACPAATALERGTIETEIWNRFESDGQRRSYQNSFARVAEPDGTFSLIALVQDVTHQTNRMEQLELMVRLSRELQGVRDLNELLHLILTCVTTGHALGFNRAFLFLRDRRTNTLRGRMAVGPSSPEDAARAWQEITARQHTLDDALSAARKSPPEESALTRLVSGLSYSLGDDGELPVRALKEQRAVLIRDAENDPRVSRDFFRLFNARSLVVLPLVSKGQSLGVIVADNLYNSRPLDERDLSLLETFATPVALAIENAEAFQDLMESLVTLRRTRQQLIDQTKLAAVGRVAAHIAHEIRNPLATIGGFAHSIKGRPDDAERVAGNAAIIYQEVMRLEKMLSGIMDFSRPTRPVLEKTALRPVLEGVAALMADQTGASIRLSVQIDPAAPEVSIDPEQFRQVLINLVRNAVEAMPGGGSVSLGARPEGKGAAVDVTDDGPGIPPDNIERVFEPFFTTKKGGTGLGLSVCRQIVIEHGGEMSIDTAIGSGTRFVIKLPQAVSPEAEGP